MVLDRELLAALDLPPIRRHLSLKSAYALGAGLETIWKVLRRPGDPPMTRFVALQLATSHSYDMTALEHDLGYRERVDLAAATRAAIEDLRARGV
ncbi:MAG: hypothetical protein R3F17_00150 [Planctomycetota bacterium]